MMETYFKRERRISLPWSCLWKNDVIWNTLD